MDSSLNIQQIGEQIRKVFPPDVELVGRSLGKVFRLIRPDIHVEWDKVQINRLLLEKLRILLDSLLWSTYRISYGESIAITHWIRRWNSIERTNETSRRQEYAVVSLSSSVS